MIPEEVISELNLPTPNQQASQEAGNDSGAVNTDFTDTSDAALEARVNQIFERRNGNAPAQQNNLAQPTAATQQQPQQQQAAVQGNNPAATVDPVAQFAQASDKAFVDDNGELNTQKVNDYFLSKGKSFLKFESAPIHQPMIEQPKQEKIDPEKEYITKARDLVDNFEEYVTGLVQQKGMTESQAIAAINAYSKDLKNQFQMRQQLNEEIKSEAGKYAEEFKRAREEKVTGLIAKNYSELGANLNDLIPGMNGTQVLDNFVLRNEYGGRLLNEMFNRDNPDFGRLPPEKQQEARNQWLRDFQADPGRFAMVAEFGRAQWFMQQLPKLIQHAQKVGAAKSANAVEATIGAPSTITSAQPLSGNSKIEQFLGFDSVN